MAPWHLFVALSGAWLLEPAPEKPAAVEPSGIHGKEIPRGASQAEGRGRLNPERQRGEGTEPRPARVGLNPERQRGEGTEPRPATVGLNPERQRGEGTEPRPARVGLNLGPYGRSGAPSPVLSLPELPRFESTVEVLGRIPPDPNQTMAVWWRHFDLPTPSLYGRGTAFRQPPPPGSVDLVPLVQWLVKKVKDAGD